MNLRILLTLLILTYSTTATRCTRFNRDSVSCDNLRNFNGSAKGIVVNNCDELVEIDKNEGKVGPWPAVNNVTFDCTITEFPWNFVNVFPNVRYINFPKCNLTTLPWQSVYTETLKIVDLSTCPIECNCQNQWMRADGSFERLKEPLSLRKCLLECNQGRIDINETIITGNAGQNVTIHVGIHDQLIDRKIEKPYFEWAYAKKQHNYEETISKTSANLVITNLSREDIGLIGIRCWHCVDYLTTKVELRVKLPIKMEFVGSTREDTEFMVIQGYPIDNITLAITNIKSNYSEMSTLGTETDSTYFSSLVVRPEKLTLFYQRTYRIFTRDAAEGDHLSGDLKFEACTLGSCDAVEKHFSHLGTANATFDDFVIIKGRNNSDVYITLGLIIFFIFVILAMFSFRYRIKLVSFLREKITTFRKHITWTQDLHSRRASQETEETLLRLEEMSSLRSSDYTNQIIPFINIGNITFHELIGKGQFGEVYCGTWGKTGPRSVAVKTIKQADKEVEKEAFTIIRLDHPNIVKLYGLTRDKDTLLIVFELMNLGELRRYLRKRAPVNGQYVQFPAALTASELIRITYEIINGVTYLVSQQIVHRDIAARNCLVSGLCDLKFMNASQRPPTTIKISDFGMSRQLYAESTYYEMENKGLLPIRWLAPEAVRTQKFTYMSDVWALGVTIWEIFTYGNLVPFEHLSLIEVSSYTMSDFYQENVLLNKPENCPPQMYELMKKCWIRDPQTRVTAMELLHDPVFDDFRPDYQKKGNALHKPVPPPVKTAEMEIQELGFTNLQQDSSSVDSSAPSSSEGEVSAPRLLNDQDLPIFAFA